MSPHPVRVLVVGASIAGPMAAYWLAKGGARVTVIERFPQFRSGGQNIDIRLGGVTIMRKIPGMEESVRQALAPMQGIGFVRDDGTPIAVMTSTGNPEEQLLVSEYEIFRDDLSRVIYDLTKDHPHINYIFNEQIASMEQQHEQDQGPLRVDFLNGTPSAEYDLVVACDGATSRTRAMAFGCGVRDHIKATGLWLAYFTLKKDILNGGNVGLARSAPGGRVLAVQPGRSGTNRAMACNAHPRIDDPGMERFRQAQKQGMDQVKLLIAEHFRDVGWKSKEILEGMLESDEFYAAEMCQVKIPSLYRGRVVLVGDSGYAAGPTGTGTSLAMTGAYILAGEITKHRDNLAAGLRAYEARMRPMIDEMHVIPPGVLSFMGPQTAVGIWLRNIVFIVVCWVMKFSSFFSWLASLWAAGFGRGEYVVPEYDWVE